MINARTVIRISLLLWVVPFSVVSAQLDEVSRLFDEGNELFREGNFEEARVRYEAVLALGYESGALYYNLGSTYYRLDRLGPAILNYLRAERLLPEDEEIAHSIEIVRTRTRDRFSEVPTPVWSRWWSAFTDLIGLKVLLWLGIVSWLAGSGLASYRLWSRDSSQRTRRAATMLCVVGVILGTASVATSYTRSISPRAVVVAERAALREGPADAERTVVSVHEGLVVDLIGSAGGWAHLRLPNGVTGYVQAGAVATI